MSATIHRSLEDWALSGGRTLATRQEFVDAVARAVRGGRGFAAGKLGVSERALLYHPVLLDRETDRHRIVAFEQSLAFKAGRQSGVFPPEPGFLRSFSSWYAEQVGELDSIGLMSDALGTLLEIFAFHRFAAQLVEFHSQEPDRSSPSDHAHCYLPHFRERKILLICPFAELLRARANRETFESVWSKTGKRWFEPAAVEALELPYGFDPATQRRYSTARTLLEELTARIDEREFDVALIAAGGLGIPLAAVVKRRGKVAISLGGHLQVLFGVLGERWRGRSSWRRRYFNDAWIELPRRYRPDPRHTSENYW